MPFLVDESVVTRIGLDVVRENVATVWQHSALSNELLKNRITLIIAHRLNTVRQANHIFVFTDRHIIEQGKHDD